MAIKSILLFGNNLLRKRCQKVEQIDQTILDILNDMAETMYAYDGAGLAAPQVGILKKLVVVDIRDGSDLVKMINPKITSRRGRIIDMEGCLSFPQQFGNVQRPESISVEYINEFGQLKSFVAEGFKARCICHEIDHLSGKLFIDYVIKDDNNCEEIN